MKKRTSLFISILLLVSFVVLVGCGSQLKDIKYRELVSVPGGTFEQFDGFFDKGFTHTISSFKMAKYQVTFELWNTVLDWAYENGYSFQNEGIKWGDFSKSEKSNENEKYEPVIRVSWLDSLVWCNAYSEMEKLKPCYTIDGEILRSSLTTNNIDTENIVCNWEVNGYRFPSEGEWYFAASYIDGKNWTKYNSASGATNDFTDIEASKKVAWFNENADEISGAIKPQIVGSKKANALGIFDMSGNVGEWCWDLYSAFPDVPQTNYRGPNKGLSRKAHGGSWSESANYLQIGIRAITLPSQVYFSRGFRVARTK